MNPRRPNDAAPQVPCKACGGTGHVDLPEHLLKTYQAVGAEPLTTAQIYKASGSRGRIPGESNRLAILEQLGLVKSRRTPGNGGPLVWWRP